MLDFLFSTGDILATIFGSLAGIIGATASFIVKVRGKSWKEIIRKIITGKDKEVEELRKAYQEQATKILDLTEKLVLEKKKNGNIQREVKLKKEEEKKKDS